LLLALFAIFGPSVRILDSFPAKAAVKGSWYWGMTVMIPQASRGGSQGRQGGGEGRCGCEEEGH